MASDRRRLRTWHGASGATLVEFALLAPLIFALLLGMLTGGLALSRKNSVENAVREATRLGATLPNATTWATAVQTRVREVSSGELANSDICVELALTTGTVASPSESTQRSTSCTLPAATEPSSSDIPRNQCIVKVWARTTSDFQVIFFDRTVTLDGSSVSRFERGSAPNCTPVTP
jgi:Flp pilus assembly protein TadG